uniref:Uncharacterized protein n=1 Tax=Cannabis sativa TaxID=3483 RepID=A0A803QBG5_CANSA
MGPMPRPMGSDGPIGPDLKTKKNWSLCSSCVAGTVGVSIGVVLWVLVSYAVVTDWPGSHDVVRGPGPCGRMQVERGPGRVSTLPGGGDGVVVCWV